MNYIACPLTDDESAELIALKERMAADEARYKELTDRAKKDQPEDGIVTVGDYAFVFYSQNRINDALFREKYPKRSELFKVVPDTTKIRKALTEDQIKEVSKPIRAFKIMELDAAIAEAEKFAD